VIVFLANYQLFLWDDKVQEVGVPIVFVGTEITKKGATDYQSAI
jgi:hypothetical protein